MELDFLFFFAAIRLGVGLAMDAFSVSLANGLREPCMKTAKMCGVAGIFAFFQALMPMLGWLCVQTIKQIFSEFEKFIPWIALALLGYIGGKMLYEGIRGEDDSEVCSAQGFRALIVQGVATSIDALSAGFTIDNYDWFGALITAVVIAIVTFIICFIGLEIGKRAGTKLAGKASIFGGAILIFIGVQIFIKGVFL